MTEPTGLLEAAREDLAHGFTVRAGTRLRQASSAGSPRALHELAQCLLDGRIPGGAREARQWLERGCELDAEGLFLRAGLRYRGVGGAHAVAEALQDLGNAATGGSAEARIEMALLWQEHANDRARAMARAWLRLAAARTDAAAALLPMVEEGADAPASALTGLAPPAANVPRQPLSGDPRIERFTGALNPVECAWLRQTSRPYLAPSRVVDPNTGAPRANPVRTSEAMYFGPARPGIFASRIAARLAGLAGLDPACGEPLAVLKYRPGQEYKPHYDGLGPRSLARDTLRAAGDRVATVLAYLNAPEAGGATLFPRLGLRIAPRPGDALVFFNLDAAGNPSPHALHAGEPVEAGEKWLVSLWLRALPVP